MKNYNILGVHWTIRVLGGGDSGKTDKEGELPKSGGLDSFQIKGGLGKKERGGVFEGGINKK